MNDIIDLSMALVEMFVIGGCFQDGGVVRIVCRLSCDGL